jgi:peptide/nickel transport system permease protein
MLGPTGQTPALVAEVRHETGFDQPVYVRYGLFMGRLLRGDLGQSYQLHQSVESLVFGQLGSTVELALTGFLLALAVATLLAMTTAGRRPVLRSLASTVELVLASLPGFWVGVLLLTFFSFRWQLFPTVGGSGINGLVLPAVTLALTLLGVFAQVMREGMERSLVEPYVLSSRARGASETTVRLRHALRHALVPMITLSGWSVGTLWLAYAGLGGRCSLPEIDHHLAQQSGLTARQYDYLAQALNDQFVGLGDDHPVPYAESFGQGAFDVE